ncbi:hypothetical protein L838_0378 [Mycobacterium avium MAV_120709_2344]|uniref:Uncharacterized protein n=1 Tax=Mycobacterium indicus pranii (strain DSM 45239 / MTCC 9506) TaxID=1232724 RepID=J9WK64_MYCIP|nr:Hypothetical protein MIP_04210 [Mycobacterium intracellulare subsp. intracellulare MTCC 9506]ETZ37656.1 hypothetical protein L839_4788 [Mycobacterium avium MAV_120809_2495]ETZ39210.1 hypothetical protein L842_5901 [Mycobacterium intracellulare MIN_052511_1280]ETZ57324.1 hypothetical protein L838_0378 [Mycobacterium avium MAV_120709_2344]
MWRNEVSEAFVQTVAAPWFARARAVVDPLAGKSHRAVGVPQDTPGPGDRRPNREHRRVRNPAEAAGKVRALAPP